MSRNALALVDCSNREKLFHFLINTFDRKCTKKEMISPYDDQLIGKMNFRYSGMEHAMFFTYARSSEYPGMKFRNHKVIYLSLDVNDISTDIFQQICTRFGGYVILDDEAASDWEKVDRQQTDNDDDLTLSEEIVAERHFLFDTEEDAERKVYKELKLEPDVEEEAEEREWAPPVVEKNDAKQEKKQNNAKNNKGHRANRQETVEQKEKQKSSDRKDTPKITVSETLRSHERQKEQREAKENKKTTVKTEHKSEPKGEQKNNLKDNGKENQKSSHRRGHRGGRKHSNKQQGKESVAQGNEKSALGKSDENKTVNQNK